LVGNYFPLPCGNEIIAKVFIHEAEAKPPFEQNAARHPKITQTHKLHNNAA
jgi:hypothetical protein